MIIKKKTKKKKKQNTHKKTKGMKNKDVKLHH